MKKTTANLLLLLIAVFWGSGFIVVKLLLDEGLGAGFINFLRGAIFALLSLVFFGRHIVKMNGRDFAVGLVAGLCNFGGIFFQTIGVQYTTPSNNAFLASTYVVMVPFFAWFMAGTKPKVKNFVSIGVCMCGMVVLSGILQTHVTVNAGDIYSLLSAVLYAVSIVYLGHKTSQTHFAAVAFMLAAVQAAGGLAYCFITGEFFSPDVNVTAAVGYALYLGVVCSFAAQSIQVAAQKYTSATSAGIIMMLEGFFGSAISVLIGMEPMSPALAVGGVLVMLSIVLAEMDISAVIGMKKFRAR